MEGVTWCVSCAQIRSKGPAKVKVGVSRNPNLT